jgi:hypothetical protein
MLPLESVDATVFTSCLHETFWLVLADGAFPFELAQVRPLGAPAPGSKREPFALTFATAQPINLPQAIYRLAHQRLGQMQLFLTQVDPQQIEAVFD